MLKQGWSSKALEAYARERYGEDIPSSTFRTYRGRLKIEEKPSVFKVDVDIDATVDVIRARAELIALQTKRIGIDVEHEGNMSKLFGTTRGEIDLLNRLLNDHKADLQDIGALPSRKQESSIEVSQTTTVREDVPRQRSLADALGLPESAEADAARQVWESLKPDHASPGE